MNLPAKFDVSSSNRSRDMEGVPMKKIRLRGLLNWLTNKAYLHKALPPDRVALVVRKVMNITCEIMQRTLWQSRKIVHRQATLSVNPS